LISSKVSQSEIKLGCGLTINFIVTKNLLFKGIISILGVETILEKSKDMALSGKVESEVEIQAPAAKFYNVFRKQLEHLPNISTHIHEAKVHEGDWENVGSVKHWEFTIGIN
jgi:uncharacterized membrane protein